MRKMERTQWAVKFVGKDDIRIDKEHPVRPVGPRQLLLKIEACGICFSDTKLLRSYDQHPRKAEVVGGISGEELLEIPSYVPGSQATVPGHEPVARIIAAGTDVRHFSVGDRVLVQADWKHLPTAHSNAAFGYNFEGALQEYVVVDERCVVTKSGEKFLLPVSETPSAASVGLVEPWATVEGAYSQEERKGPLREGRMLIVFESSSTDRKLEAFLEEASAGEVEYVDLSQGDQLPKPSTEGFDDIVYFGSKAVTIEKLEPLLRAHGILNVVLSGETIEREVAVDIGRIHYDFIRYCGTTGSNPADGYRWIPSSDELPPRGRILLIGAAGPMGSMHVIRAISLLGSKSEIIGTDVSDERLNHLASLAGPAAESRGINLQLVNTAQRPMGDGYDYVVCLVPSQQLVAEAIQAAGSSGVLNIFAGIPAGTLGPIDLQRVIAQHIFLIGSSGSTTADMQTVLSRIEAGTLDTTVALGAITGMAGVPEAFQAVQNRTAPGKIMVYPQLHDLGYLTMSDLMRTYPSVARLLSDGRWTPAAEKELLECCGA
ncbi:alcohol dehydrogenase catalytic domain-containing protein [Actinomycetaceae bacterium WB03_NA08]|uniref:Alcohol dehydrogenase catalytic domain-containing protein n=2 Tax=Scrofimicrobium canadense TaxID=2652290 RepID=A0A6N7W5Q6_9ACTO|nr:alcohol dehydrogenase catalytic domain-containing protein [Scrofimicrobium canadense]